MNVNGDWPKNLLGVMMIALPKRNQASKYSDHITISLISHTRKAVECILSKILKSKIEEVTEEDTLDSRKIKALEMLLD